MTIATASTSTCPSVFDEGLPTIAYNHLTDFEEAHRVIAVARRHAPIAMGPHAPEVLSYELVRTVLRDPRFVTHGAWGWICRASPPVRRWSGRSPTSSASCWCGRRSAGPSKYRNAPSPAASTTRSSGTRPPTRSSMRRVR